MMINDEIKQLINGIQITTAENLATEMYLKELFKLHKHNGRLMSNIEWSDIENIKNTYLLLAQHLKAKTDGAYVLMDEIMDLLYKTLVALIKRHEYLSCN